MADIGRLKLVVDVLYWYWHWQQKDFWFGVAKGILIFLPFHLYKDGKKTNMGAKNLPCKEAEASRKSEILGLAPRIRPRWQVCFATVKNIK